MEDGMIRLQWPRESLTAVCFVHEIMNYRYHWHPDLYEVNILLSGGQEYCRGLDTRLLEEDDVILTSPGTGHGSFAPQANTRALVVQFSSSLFRSYVKKGQSLSFPSCLSSAEDRNAPRYRALRFYCAQLWTAANRKSLSARQAARASLDLIAALLTAEFEPEPVHTLAEQDTARQELFHGILAYIDEHYAEKLSLEDLASFSQYNRTYLSTLFKETVGVSFYEYLTRVRIQHVLMDLAGTGKTLTQAALDNGFPDLKSLNARFRQSLHRTPAEYRAQLSPDRIMRPGELRSFVSPDDPILCRKIQEYTALGTRHTAAG